MEGTGALGQKGHKFFNWAKTRFCTPELYFEPNDVEQIKQILSLARSRSKKVKVVGCGNSPSDLACTPDYMINMKHINRIIKIDQETCVVKMEGGITIADVNTLLDQNGLALSVQAAISNVTVAGAISTGTHGTGAQFGTMSSYVLELELMTAAGDVMTLSRTQNKSVFMAALTGLGCVGVILSATVECERAFRLQQKQYPIKLQDMLENLDDHITTSEHFQFLYFPHTEGCIAVHMNRTEKPVERKQSWFWGQVVGYYFLEFLYWTSSFLPSLVAGINSLYLRLYSSPTQLVDKADKVFNFNCLFKQYVMEWAVPREKTASVLQETKAWIAENNFKAHFPIVVRFVRGDDIWLSPAYSQDSAYIQIIMYRPYDKFVAHGQYWQAFADIMRRAGGRPHWAKDHDMTGKEFQSMYPHWQDFCDIRKQLDPAGMFLNDHLTKVFSV